MLVALGTQGYVTQEPRVHEASLFSFALRPRMGIKRVVAGGCQRPATTVQQPSTYAKPEAASAVLGS
jgi:hypothetical protein